MELSLTDTTAISWWILEVVTEKDGDEAKNSTMKKFWNSLDKNDEVAFKNQKHEGDYSSFLFIYDINIYHIN